MTTLTFPDGFRWGVATAAAQIEGAGHEDGKGDSIWDVLCRQKGAIVDGSDIDVACDHYHRMGSDISLMKDLGVGTYRFSVSWSRVMPDGHTPNPVGIAFYEHLVDALVDAGIRPWLTLYHWDLPQPLQERGGWTSRGTARAFADYARFVYGRLGAKVDTWTTLNEPWCSSFLSYAAGEHAPAHTDPAEAVSAVHHLLLAHGWAVAAIRESARERGEDPRVGITLNFTTVHAADPQDPGDRDAARRIDGVANRVFLDPLFRGSYPADVIEDMRGAGEGCDILAHVEAGDMDAIRAPLDVLGVNFYNGCMVAAPDPDDRSPLVTTGAGGRPRRSPNVGSERVRYVARDLPHTAMGWEVDPDDLYLLLTRLHREYTSTAGPGGTGIPLVITENGAAYEDRPDASGFVDDSADRLLYIRDHLGAVHRAIRDGARVEGYLVWSLMDNFEWAWGYTRRFGVVRVDYDTLERTPKASGLWFGRVARTNTVEVD